MSETKRETRPIPVLAASVAAMVMAGSMNTWAGAAASPPPSPASSSLVLPLDEVQMIAGAPTLKPDGIGNGHTPRADHALDPRMSPPCRRALNQDERFDVTWSNFITVGYIGPSNVGVRQTVAAYPDTATARGAYERLTTAEQQCRAAYPVATFGGPPEVTVLDVDTLLIQTEETVNGPGSAELVHRRGQVVIDVGAFHYSTDPKIARAVLTHMIERIS